VSKNSAADLFNDFRRGRACPCPKRGKHKALPLRNAAKLLLGYLNIVVGDKDFFIDLLFYHTQLHCYIVIELKTTDFEPEYVGKLNFYLKAVDVKYRKEGDQPTIGLLICKSKNKVIAEYALSDIHKPIGVSEYQLTQALPDNLKPSLPSIEELERELGMEQI